MDPSETKYQYLIKKRKKMVLNDWKYGIYENIESYNSKKPVRL